MYVRLGNVHAIEVGEDPSNPSRLRARKLPGQRVTTLLMPKTIGLQEAVMTVLATLPRHFEPDTVPSWVESDSDGLKEALDQCFGFSQPSIRPATWGEPVEVPDNVASIDKVRGARL